jgi:hypothetical protein
VVRIEVEVAISSSPCLLGCAVELALRITPLRRGQFPVDSSPRRSAHAPAALLQALARARTAASASAFPVPHLAFWLTATGTIYCNYGWTGQEPS